MTAPESADKPESGGPCETPLDDLERSALAHYEDVSSKAHHWSNTIPKAIRFYFDAKRQAAAVPESQALKLGEGQNPTARLRNLLGEEWSPHWNTGDAIWKACDEIERLRTGQSASVPNAAQAADSSGDSGLTGSAPAAAEGATPRTDALKFTASCTRIGQDDQFVVLADEYAKLERELTEARKHGEKMEAAFQQSFADAERLTRELRAPVSAIRTLPPGDPLTQPGDSRREDRAPASTSGRSVADLLPIIRHNEAIDENGDPLPHGAPETQWEEGYCAGIRCLYRFLKSAVSATRTRSEGGDPAEPRRD